MHAGVELGGTKCVCILAAGPSEIAARETVPTTMPEETLGRIEAILARWRFERLGIASFGPVDLDPASPRWGYITSTPKPGWRGVDVAGRLGRAAGRIAAFDTDVNGAALAEMRWGAGRGLADFAYVTVGTGIGVGLVANGAPMRGFQHCELGHVRIARLPGDSWPGACPYHGDCVEGLAAGPAIAARTGRSGAEIEAGDGVWEGVAHALAQLCHAIVAAAAPRRIVVGGGVASARPELLALVEAKLIESLAGYMTLPASPYLLPPGLGDLAGPLGPIALAARAGEQEPGVG
ncbi:MAG: ROK family protein [Alphaproteobacteria bacterium]|nr:ROK family protein [Alphaproteobacteria bacterium]MBV9370118.1 ROK family protein [Alphaproteobacteria bacterium]MBV9901458.1 ROK family protein [Alphaproteobacteria bacterium]